MKMIHVGEGDRAVGPTAILSRRASGGHFVESWPLTGVPLDVRDKWLDLLAASEGPNPVRQTPASLAVTAALDDRLTIEILGVRDAAGEIIGIQPLQYGPLSLDFNLRHRTFLALPIGGVTLIGSEPLTARADEKPFILQCILGHLRHVRAIEFKLLERGGTIEREVQRFAQAGRTFHRAEYPGNWTYADVPASMAGYASSLGKKKLYNLKRQNRLLGDHLGGDLELVVVRDAADLALLIDATRQLTGWAGTRLRWAERHAELACREGVACFFVLKCKDRLVGLVRATAWGDKLSVQSMHRDSTLDKFSPGTALWQTVLNWLIEGGVVHRVIFNYGTPMPGNRAINVVEDRSHVFVVRRGVWVSAVVGLHRAFLGSKSLLGRARSAWQARSRKIAAMAAD